MAPIERARAKASAAVLANIGKQRDALNDLHGYGYFFDRQYGDELEPQEIVAAVIDALIEGATAEIDAINETEPTLCTAMRASEKTYYAREWLTRIKGG